MASFEAKKLNFGDINGGQRFENGDMPEQVAFNAPIEASAYAQDIADRAITIADQALQFQQTSGGTLDVLTAYPIGSIYISTNAVEPAQMFGGTWEKIEDAFLYGSGAFALGASGGSADAVVAGHKHTTLDLWGVSGWQNFSSSGTCLNFITGSGKGHGIGLRLDKLKEDGYIGLGADQVLCEDGSYRYLNQTSSDGTRKEGANSGDFSSEAFVDAKGKNMPPYLVVNIWERIA